VQGTLSYPSETGDYQAHFIFRYRAWGRLSPPDRTVPLIRYTREI